MSRDRALLAGARVFFNDRTLMLEDLKIVVEGEPPGDGCAIGYLVDPAAWVSVADAHDRRGQPVQKEEEGMPPPSLRAPGAARPKPRSIPRLPPPPTRRRV